MAMKQIHKQRLLKLCGFMERLTRTAIEHFDMSSFLSHTGFAHAHKLPNTPKELIHSCGTTACAAGWAASVPSFRKLGLTRHEDGFVFGEETVFGVPFREYAGCGKPNLDDVFGPQNQDKTPKAWAKRVRKLVAQWSKA